MAGNSIGQLFRVTAVSREHLNLRLNAKNPMKLKLFQVYLKVKLQVHRLVC